MSGHGLVGVADAGAFLARLTRLDPAALVRLRAAGARTALWARLPWNVLVTREVANDGGVAQASGGVAYVPGGVAHVPGGVAHVPGGVAESVAEVADAGGVAEGAGGVWDATVSA
ncbi:MAG TPA: hypothetical protein VH502_08685, partial [Actinoplanes sp.]